MPDLIRFKLLVVHRAKGINPLCELAINGVYIYAKSFWCKHSMSLNFALSRKFQTPPSDQESRSITDDLGFYSSTGSSYTEAGLYSSHEEQRQDRLFSIPNEPWGAYLRINNDFDSELYQNADNYLFFLRSRLGVGICYINEKKLEDLMSSNNIESRNLHRFLAWISRRIRNARYGSQFRVIASYIKFPDSEDRQFRIDHPFRNPRMRT